MAAVPRSGVGSDQMQRVAKRSDVPRIVQDGAVDPGLHDLGETVSRVVMTGRPAARASRQAFENGS